MTMQRAALRAAFGVGAMLTLVACAPSVYVVKAPTASGMKYVVPAAPAETQLAFIDNRQGDERIFHSGILAATLNVDGAPVDAPQFLAKHVSAELTSRGVPVKAATDANGLPRVSLNTFRVQNHRANGFAPFVTFTMISADLETPSGKKRVGVFVKRGKVPVWSFDEVVEPTFNEPLSIAVKEFSSKVANQLYAYRASDEVVKSLTARLATRTDASYLDVYALGFTNNLSAVDTLVKYTTDQDEYVRLAAISSLGNLGATSQLGLLKSIYEKPDGMWQDRAMAIKAIADLGTPDALSYVGEELKRHEKNSGDKDSLWTSQILGLYL